MKHLRKFKLNESVESDSTTLKSAIDKIKQEADDKIKSLIDELKNRLEEYLFDISDHNQMKTETFEKQGNLITKIEFNLFTPNGDNVTEELFQVIIDSFYKIEGSMKLKPHLIDFRYALITEITDPARQLYSVNKSFSVEWKGDVERYLTDLKNKFIDAISFKPDPRNPQIQVAFFGAKKVFLYIQW